VKRTTQSLRFAGKARKAARFLALAFVACLPLMGEVALAQDLVPPADVGGGNGYRLLKPRRGGFFEMLFGPSLLEPFRPPPPPQQTYAPPPPSQPSEPPVPTVQILPKDKDARKILVVGDFVADGVAWGLDQTFAQEPKLAIVDDSNANSGLARADYYDWNAELPKLLNQEKPDIIVVALGANDRQELRNGNERFATHSDAWEQAYIQRIKGLTSTLKVYGRPFFWVSAPPMRVSAAARDMAYLNEFYKPAVAEAGGYFVDVWDGFTSDEGNYISSGPDVNGQLRSLRLGDGINFSRAGRLKLAFYVEREIRRQTGLGEGKVDLLTSTNQNNQVEIGPDGQKHLVGPVISLTSPPPGASDALAGGPNDADAAKKNTDSPGYRMIVKGEALPRVSGRADDFTWPAPATAAPAAAAPATATPAAAAPVAGQTP
jgi:hypothetical protein